MQAPTGGRKDRGFTILEIATVIVIILIIATLLIPAYSQVRARMDKASCMNNLRQLYVAGGAYLQDHGQWPQVDPALFGKPNNAYYEPWITAFLPYGVGRINWICPTTERNLGGPNYMQQANYRADYMAMPFDTKRITPNLWPTSPWFVEKGNVHGNGNLYIQANGSITELTQMMQMTGTSGH